MKAQEQGMAICFERLVTLLAEMQDVAVAVSGGVDSTTLAALAHKAAGKDATMFHARSAAVPRVATERLCRLADKEGWNLRVIDAGELQTLDYTLNPVDRCYYCKSCLYSTIARYTEATILSGTNLDDLADFRPGLKAASEMGVRHPFVEAGIDKNTLRDIARRLDLADFADLPASPCLSSRVETGIPLDSELLEMIEKIEESLNELVDAKALRCRIRSSRLVIEIDETTLSCLSDNATEGLALEVQDIAWRYGRSSPVSIAPYKQGSAFLRGETLSP